MLLAPENCRRLYKWTLQYTASARNCKGITSPTCRHSPPGERLTATITAANETGGANEDMQSHECVADGWRRNIRGQCDCAAVPVKIDPDDCAIGRRGRVGTR